VHILLWTEARPDAPTACERLEVSGKYKQLKFDNLPLMEAAVRVTFQEPLHFTYEVIYEIRRCLQDQFKALEEPPHFEIVPGKPHEPIRIGPGLLPGFVLAGEANGLRVSVQQQLIVARWVRESHRGSPAYPRYLLLRQALWDTVKATRAAYGGEIPPIIVTNMSYVDLISATNPELVMARYFAPCAHVGATNGASAIQKIEAAWTRLRTDFRYAIERARGVIDGEEIDGFRLTTVAGTRLTEGATALDALDGLHNELQDFFLALISDQAKMEWKLREDDNG